jgi:hypothetical protein
MHFLDKKEQVIDLQLTQYGKHLLSLGKFRAQYYSFFDDDIIYDSQYGGFNEDQKETEKRINDMPRIATQHVHYGIEAIMTELVKKIRRESKTAYDLKLGGNEPITRGAMQPTLDKSYALSAPLGNSSTLTSYRPSWTVHFLEGELSGSVQNVTGALPAVKIPQLKTQVEYKTSVKTLGIHEPSTTFTDATPGNVSVANQGLDIIDDADLVGDIYPDDTFIDVEGAQIMLQIDENNVDFLNENFDIEVYEIENVTLKTSLSSSVNKGMREELNQLLFIKDAEQVDNIGPDYVEYYFDLLVDREIEEDALLTAKASDIGVKLPFKNIYGPTGEIMEEDCD